MAIATVCSTGTGRVAMREENKIKFRYAERYVDTKNSSLEYRIIYLEAFALSTIGNILQVVVPLLCKDREKEHVYVCI
jgi:hypothetical protein